MKTICAPKYAFLIALQLVVTDNPVDRTVALQNLAHMFLHFLVVNCEMSCRQNQSSRVRNQSQVQRWSLRSSKFLIFFLRFGPLGLGTYFGKAKSFQNLFRISESLQASKFPNFLFGPFFELRDSDVQKPPVFNLSIQNFRSPNAVATCT